MLYFTREGKRRTMSQEKTADDLLKVLNTLTLEELMVLQTLLAQRAITLIKSQETPVKLKQDKLWTPPVNRLVL